MTLAALVIAVIALVTALSVAGAIACFVWFGAWSLSMNAEIQAAYERERAKRRSGLE